MRKLFTDKWNSFWHFAFGSLSFAFFWGIPIFVAYQLIEPYEQNTLIDLVEFVIGYCVTYLAWQSYNRYSSQKSSIK